MTPDTLETQNTENENTLFAWVETPEDLEKAKEDAEQKVIAQTEEELQQLEDQIA